MSDELDRKLQQLAHEQAESARAPLEWAAVSERANQTPAARHVRRWPAAAAAAVLIVAGVAVIALVRGDGSDTASPATLPAGPDSSDPAAPRSPDASQFCDAYAAMVGERPEDYVGSSEHVSDIDILLDAAPPEIASDVATFRNFVASGAIDTGSDPDSNLTANWPSEVQLAIDAIQDFATANCATPSQTSSGTESPSESHLVYGLSTNVGLAVVDSASLEVSPLAGGEPFGSGRGQLSPVSPERFVVSTGVESNGFIPCDAEIVRVDDGSVTARAGGLHSATYSESHDLIAAIKLGAWYSEDQCVGESVVLLDQDFDVVAEIDRGDGDGVPPAFKSVVWTEAGSLIIVVDQLADLVDQYDPGRSDLLVYEIRSGSPEQVSFLGNPGDEVWTSAASSGDELLLVSATGERSLVRTVAIDELVSVFQEGVSWSEMTDVREYDGFVFSVVGLPDGGIMVSLLSDSPASDAVISSQSDRHDGAGLSGLAAIPTDFALR